MFWKNKSVNLESIQYRTKYRLPNGYVLSEENNGTIFLDKKGKYHNHISINLLSLKRYDDPHIHMCLNGFLKGMGVNLNILQQRSAFSTWNVMDWDLSCSDEKYLRIYYKVCNSYEETWFSLVLLVADKNSWEEGVTEVEELVDSIRFII